MELCPMRLAVSFTLIALHGVRIQNYNMKTSSHCLNRKILIFDFFKMRIYLGGGAARFYFIRKF